MTGTEFAEDDYALTHLRLTARLNTSALDTRRGVVRLHPEAIAALGLREWDAVALTGATDHRGGGRGGPARHTDRHRPARRRHAVQRGPAGDQHGDRGTGDGLRRAVGDGDAVRRLATQSISSATLRQALLGKVMTVGDTVSLLPRDLGPGTSTSAATSALASSVGITWTSELLTVTGVDPAGPRQRAAQFGGQLG